MLFKNGTLLSGEFFVLLLIQVHSLASVWDACVNILAYPSCLLNALASLDTNTIY